VDGNTYKLPDPFFVMATQNPIELEGTFPLPEAQLDRFLLRMGLGYPSKDEESAILERFQETDPLQALEPVAAPEQSAELQHARRTIRVSKSVREYITDTVRSTRSHPSVRLGASPRGSLALMRAGQALAGLRKREYVLPDDIKALASPVLAHRIILKEEDRLRGHSQSHVIEDIMRQVPVPIPGA
jgi:MoxR-like ATPase